MLLRFAVENFMSFREQQVFSMVAGKYTKHRDHIVHAGGKRLLKGSFLFGANAAGKSNLLRAVSFARDIVLDGIEGTTLTNRHFRIDKNYAAKPGVFQFDIFANEHFYSYGFAISYINSKIEEEWLYLCDQGETAIFERSQEDDNLTVKTDFRFSDSKYQHMFEVYADNISDDKLLLSEISERKLIDHEDFQAYKDVKEWFKRLTVIFPESIFTGKSRFVSEVNNPIDTVKLLSAFDTGVEGIEVTYKDIDDVLDFLDEKTKQILIMNVERNLNRASSEGDNPPSVETGIEGRFIRFEKHDNQIVASQLMMNHGNQNDPFDMSDESDGTKRLFDLIPVYRITKQPWIVFVDELDRSFHTKLVIQYIQWYYELTENINSQLIATVHDANIMDLELLRQDEIWFVQREPDHASSIYSLSMYKERFDKKVSKDYLLGRYGAIPCIEQVDIEIEEEE